MLVGLRVGCGLKKVLLLPSAFNAEFTPICKSSILIVRCSDQIPDLVASVDATNLVSLAYWPSFNVPFFEVGVAGTLTDLSQRHEQGGYGGSGIILSKSPWLSGGSIFVCRALGRFLSLVEPLPSSPPLPHSLIPPLPYSRTPWLGCHRKSSTRQGTRSSSRR